jgi:hypothetical protein
MSIPPSYIIALSSAIIGFNSSTLTMAMARMGAGDIILIGQVGTAPDSDRLLTHIEMGKAWQPRAYWCTLFSSKYWTSKIFLRIFHNRLVDNFGNIGQK